MKKKILLSCIILIIMMIVIVIAMLLININKKSDKIEEIPELTFTTEIQEVTMETTFAIVENCINKYYNFVNNQEIQKTYDLLSTNYKTKNNITRANALDHIEKLENGFEKFRALNINYKELDFDKCQYYVLGELIEKDYVGKRNVYIVVNIDHMDENFSIEPKNITVRNKDEYFSIIDKLDNEEQFEVINNNTNNILEYQASMTTQEILDYYMNDYKMMAIYYYQDAYNLLNKAYREKRFEDVEDYKKYIDQNIDILNNTKIMNYTVENKQENIIYTVVDNYNNTYLFEVNGAMNYNVILDMHTMNLDVINETYNKASEQEKVAINIHKIVSALNSRDYRYLYNKLSDGFKINNYPTIDSLVNELDSKLVGTYNVSFNSFYVEGNTYIYNIILNENMGNDNNLDMEIIMQLIDSNDFIMSFSIK